MNPNSWSGIIAFICLNVIMAASVYKIDGMHGVLCVLPAILIFSTLFATKVIDSRRRRKIRQHH